VSKAASSARSFGPPSTAPGWRSWRATPTSWPPPPSSHSREAESAPEASRPGSAGVEVVAGVVVGVGSAAFVVAGAVVVGADAVVVAGGVVVPGVLVVVLVVSPGEVGVDVTVGSVGSVGPGSVTVPGIVVTGRLGGSRSVVAGSVGPGVVPVGRSEIEASLMALATHRPALKTRIAVTAIPARRGCSNPRSVFRLGTSGTPPKAYPRNGGRNELPPSSRAGTPASEPPADLGTL
jgi:hypothetical protein